MVGWLSLVYGIYLAHWVPLCSGYCCRTGLRSVVPSGFFGATYLLSRSFSEIPFGSCFLHMQACLDRISKPKQGGVLFPLGPCADNLSCPSCVDLKGLTSRGQLDFQIPGMSPCRSIGTNYRADTSLGQNFREDLRRR